MFFCDFCNICKSTFFTGHLYATDSIAAPQITENFMGKIQNWEILKLASFQNLNRGVFGYLANFYDEAPLLKELTAKKAFIAFRSILLIYIFRKFQNNGESKLVFSFSEIYLLF